MPMNIVIYTNRSCPDCGFLRRLLEQKKLPYTEVPVDSNEARKQFRQEHPDAKWIPTVVVDGKELNHFTEVGLLKAEP